MSFKILAIRAIKSNRYLKNLSTNVLYAFTLDYEFKENEKHLGSFRDICGIESKATSPKNLYDITMANDKPLSIHISAIVGKNGSGKSSLLELLYLTTYCLAERKGYTNDRIFNQRQVDRGFTREYFDEYKEQVNSLIEKTEIEIYYEINNDFYVFVTGEQQNLRVLNKNKGTWTRKGYKPELFFYTIVVNYSLYGLNSKDTYYWLHALFHKNDGYKTPLVLNPFRDDGVIDVNSELHLAQTRILTNLVDKRLDSEQMVAGKKVHVIKFDVDPEAVGWFEGLRIGEIFDLTKNHGGADLISVFETLTTNGKLIPNLNFDEIRRVLSQTWKSKGLVGKTESDGDRAITYQDIRMLLAEYIITKLAKICHRYDDYHLFTETVQHPKQKEMEIRLLHNPTGFLTRIREDKSHVTLKLFQAINAYKYFYFSDKTWRKIRHPDSIKKNIYRCEVSIKELSVIVNEALDDNLQLDAIRFVPAAMFRPSIVLVDNDAECPFVTLSSGEQHLLHAIHCILYHLLNIDTLQNSKVSYEFVNIVLDEIELYYHPEYQRQFVQTLIGYFENLRLQKIKGLNIIFSTHSPFILSDIPHQNVLKLIKGKIYKSDVEERTFGANIHEMLAKSFFLDEDLVGAFAKNQIDKLIEEVNHLENLRQLRNQNTRIIENDSYETLRKTENETKRIAKGIDLIGERVVQLKLKEMYYQAMQPEENEKAKALLVVKQLMDRYGLIKENL